MICSKKFLRAKSYSKIDSWSYYLLFSSENFKATLYKITIPKLPLVIDKGGRGHRVEVGGGDGVREAGRGGGERAKLKIDIPVMSIMFLICYYWYFIRMTTRNIRTNVP